MDMKQQVRALRRRAGMNKAAWARALGVGWQTVNRWELGKRKPHPVFVDKMERVAAGKRGA